MNKDIVPALEEACLGVAFSVKGLHTQVSNVLCCKHSLFRVLSVCVLMHFTWFKPIALEKDSQAQIASKHACYT